MFKRVSIALACSALLLAATAARADDWDKKTTLTFSQPVELPGVTLPAGTYVFKLANVPGTRSIVQVFNEDQNEIYATILAIPRVTMTPHDKPYVGFEERAAGLPMAIREWFYPGHNTGVEFVYPKARAVELAREFHEPVLAAEVKPAEEPAELAEAPVVEVTPENKEVQLAETFDYNDVPEIAEAAPATLPPPHAETTAVLPQTASPVPLIAMLGFLALVAAVGLKALVTNRG